LAAQAHHLPNPHLLVSPFIHREAVLSSRIEGTQADLADVYAYRAGQLALPGVNRAPEADVHEVTNYIIALDYGLNRMKQLPVGKRLMRELHARLLEGVRGAEARPGEFRRKQNYIAPHGASVAEARYVPPPASHLDQCLDDLEKYLHADDYPPLVRLALIHYQFEAIHPFLDGNGRIGRLLISLLLVYWDLLPLPLLYLSAFFERNRAAYYDLLRAVSERAAWNEWIAFFLRGVAEQAADATNRAKQLQALQAEWRQLLTRARASSLVPALADSLFDEPVLTISQAQKRLGVTYRTAGKVVRHLEEVGILMELTGATQNRVYMAQRILEIAQASEAR
jgi:Fic family protein